jgi:hypothetical protein
MYLFNKLFTSTVQFKPCDMNRDNYIIFLPDDILLQIINLISNRLYLSFVSYQFYILNRTYVSKCYHLQHLIPIIKNQTKISYRE